MSFQNPVVVHLVHGTWPYGLFRRKFHKQLAWFEKGSKVRSEIEKLSEKQIQFRTFEWSGRNSFRDRYQAGRDLRKYLLNSLREGSNAQHIIIAHSHGGTVVEQAVADSHRSSEYSAIKAIVCLATPFAYAKAASRRQTENLVAAIAYGITSSIMLTILAVSTFAFNWISFLLVFALLPLPPVTLNWLLLSFAGNSRYVRSDVSVHSAIPIFLIRGTRDEASFAIGFAQIISIMMAWPFRTLGYGEEGRSYRRFLATRWRMIIFVFPLVLPVEIWIYLRSPDMSSWQILLLMPVAGDAIASFVLWIGFFLVAFAVGFWDVRFWPWSQVEVDAAPESRNCCFKAFSDLQNDKAESLRHGLYDYVVVQKEIAFIIRAVAEGRHPTFVSEG